MAGVVLFSTLPRREASLRVFGQKCLILSKAPGDFWVLQMAEDGYTVEKFVYREGDYTVWYTLEPKSYTVYYEDYMAGKEE